MIKRIQREEEETSGLQWWELGSPAVGLSSCRLRVKLSELGEPGPEECALILLQIDPHNLDLACIKLLPAFPYELLELFL